MTSRSLSYTANAGFFDGTALSRPYRLDGTIYVRGLSPGSYTGFFVMGKEAFFITNNFVNRIAGTWFSLYADSRKTPRRCLLK